MNQVRPKLRLVIAGNFEQYRRYLRDKGFTPEQARYVSSRQSIMGLEPGQVIIVRVGQSHLNPGSYDDQVRMLEALGAEKEFA